LRWLNDNSTGRGESSSALDRDMKKDKVRGEPQTLSGR
jgi:hypothetical protein